ncbi:sporulation protein [Comamonas terrae]|uniref:SPOR domain-containing protein n=1 Tax=Comamonas terrae TaxID=673548 RepID=A0ABW5UMT1_9BURK|nr:sporulation protein [Comamonas terrae]
MLRIAFLLLVLANAGYYLWSHGQLAAWGLAPATQSEPQRLEQQIKPEALEILPSAPPAPAAPSPEPVPAAPVAAAAATEAAAARGPAVCLQAAGVEERQADNLRRALAQLPREQWELIANHQPGRWMVYMGKFPDAEFLDRKRAELRALKIDFDRAGGNLEPGLSLGRFSTEEAATRQLTAFARQGVRTARVVQERPDVTTYTLRLPKATPALRAEVETLAGRNLDARALRACAR